jgi:hypothetical protein
MYTLHSSQGKGMHQTTFAGLMSFLGVLPLDTTQMLLQRLYDKKNLSWVRFVGEHPVLHGQALNTFIRYGLYNHASAIRHFFKCPLKPAMLYIFDKSTHHISLDTGLSHIQAWTRDIHPVLKNVEALRLDMLQDSNFSDACRLAKKLGYFINCSWSLKRLKSEHDKWSQELSDILLKYEPEIELKPYSDFIEFGQFSGYELLVTNKQLLAEGHRLQHCVGSYASTVTSGHSGIYSLRDGKYTLELRRQGRDLYLRQAKGLRNTAIPDELDVEIRRYIDEYNLQHVAYSGDKQDIQSASSNDWMDYL